MTTPPEPPTPTIADLLPAEQQLASALRRDEWCDLADPALGLHWRQRRVRAAFLAEVLTGQQPATPLPRHGLHLTHAFIEGDLDLFDATIAGTLTLIRCRFRRSVSSGERRTDINLNGSNLPSLLLSGTHIGALDGDGLTVEGDVFLDDAFRATREVRLLGAHIGGDLVCSDGRFTHASGDALSAHRASIGGGVFLRERFRATGEVGLSGARIGSDLDCSGGCFAVLNLQGAQVPVLFLRGMPRPPTMLSLDGASVTMLIDDATSWPAAGQLSMGRFTFEAIAPGSPHAAADRLDWLRRQPADPESGSDVGAYEQLAALYDRLGRPDDAFTIRSARRKLIRGRQSRLPWRSPSLAYWSNLMTGAAMRIGHHIAYLAVMAALLLGVGAGMFQWAERAGAMIPRTAPITAAPPTFSAAIYDLDTFLPVIDLGQERAWTVDGGVRLPLPGDRYLPGWLVSIYLVIHILSGWMVATVLLGWFVGLTRRQ